MDVICKLMYFIERQMLYLDSNFNQVCPLGCNWQGLPFGNHYDDVIMGSMASQITNLTIAYSSVYSDADQRKHQSFASLAFVRGIHRGPVNSPHKWPVTRKMIPFDDVFIGLVNSLTEMNNDKNNRRHTWRAQATTSHCVEWLMFMNNQSITDTTWSPYCT